MRLKYDRRLREEIGDLVIRLKEDPVEYYEEYTKFQKLISAYYSEKKELVEIIIRDVESREGREEFEEILIPDIMPMRKYAYAFGKDDVKICAEDVKYLNVYDGFLAAESLRIERVDGKEMPEWEIKKLRKAIFEDINADDFCFIGSVYKNKKLYFWVEKEEAESIEIIYDLGYEMIGERELGADFVINHDEALIWISGEHDTERKIGTERKITKEKLINICKNTNEYKNRRIFLDLATLSEETIKYANSQNIKIQNFEKLLIERNMREAEINDDIRDEIDITEIFGSY